MSRRGTALAALVVLLVHGALLWLYWMPAPKVLFGDETGYWTRAAALAAGREPPPELLWPPLYAHFLAALLRATGSLGVAVQVVQTALLAWTAFVARDVALRWTGSRRQADLLAVALLAYPTLAAFAHFLWPEILHLALVTSAVWILTARPDRLLWLAVLGVLLGLALLTKSLMGPFLPVLLAPLLRSGPARRRLLRVAVVGACLAVTVAPTVAENARRHRVFAIANSAWFNLWVGLNDVSRLEFRRSIVERELARYRQSADSFAERNAVLRERILALVRERGPLRVLADQLGRQYFRLLAAESFLTAQLPDGAARRDGYGYRAPPPPVATSLRLAHYAAWAAVLAAAPFGVALWLRGRPPWLWACLAFLGYHAVLFLLLHAKTRYRIPGLPVLLLLAVSAFDAAASGRLRRELSLRAALLSGGVATLLLFLAFGGPLLEAAPPS